MVHTLRLCCVRRSSCRAVGNMLDDQVEHGVPVRQLRHAALELLPPLLTGAAALLKDGAACATGKIFWDNYRLAVRTMVCSWPVLTL